MILWSHRVYRGSRLPNFNATYDLISYIPGANVKINIFFKNELGGLSDFKAKQYRTRWLFRKIYYDVRTIHYTAFTTI